MLDLQTRLQPHPAELYSALTQAGLQLPPTSSAPRGRAYAGPERRGAASLQNRRMSQMLDTLDYGMLLLSDVNHVQHINKAARRDLDDTHPLMLDNGTLQARQPTDVVPLREALVGAQQRGLRRLLQLGLGRQRISVAIVPLPALGADGQCGVTVLLGKRQMCEELTVEWYARAHNLTMAETAVMKGLCADLTPQEIATRQGVGLATVRTQIGSIRIKTGANSIRALVQQVALLPPLVSALQGSPSSQALGQGTSARGANQTGAGHDRVLNA